MLQYIAALLVTGYTPPGQGPTAQQVPVMDALGARIDFFVRPYAISNNFSGVILVRRKGRVQFEKGYGMANHELGARNTPRTRFHIASVSKAFTAAAILLLEERGKLSTADSVARLIPGYPRGDQLRLEHLLKHTSGIPNLGSLPEWSREERMPHEIEELVGMFKDRPLEFEPGSEERYSNSNYNLLALILEKVSGQGYEAFLRQHIWGPLDLGSTLDGGDMTRIIPDRASGTEPEGIRGTRFPRYLDWSGRRGSGSLVTTAADLDRFVAALFGGRLLQPGSVAKILAPAAGFAFGWARDERFGRKQMRAGGRSPGFNASVEYYLDDGATVIVLSNSYSPVAQDPVFLEGLHSSVWGKAAAPPSLTPIPIPAGSLAEFAGPYRMPRDYFIPDATLTLADRGDRLEALWRDGARNTIYAVGPNRFLDRNFWATVSFSRDSVGSVTGFSYSLASQRFVAKKLDH